MNHKIESTTSIDDPQDHPPELFVRLKGEPNLWYDRFFRFCLYGPSRSLLKCYRDIMHERDLLAELMSPDMAGTEETPRKPSKALRRWVPSSWRVKSREFNWWARAEAFDADQRSMAAQKVEEAMRQLMNAACEAVQFQIDLMHGKIKDPDGNLVPVSEVHQRRLASNSILNRAGVVYDGPNVDEEDGEVEVMGITVHLKSET